MLGAVVQQPHQPPREPREEVGGLQRIGDGRRFRIEEDHEVDVGREVELVGAELAHAENDPARSPARPLRVDKLQLALAIGIDEQEVDGGANAGVGKVAQPAHRQFRLRLAGQFGQRDQEMRLELEASQGLHHATFGGVFGTRGSADLRQDGVEPFGDVAVEQRVQHFRPPPRAVAQERRQVQDGREKVALLALAGQQGGEPREFRLGRRCRDLGDFLGGGIVVERRQGQAGLQAQVRPAGLRCRSAVHSIRPWLRGRP